MYKIYFYFSFYTLLSLTKLFKTTFMNKILVFIRVLFGIIKNMLNVIFDDGTDDLVCTF